jgi:hypothetical protein
LQIGNQASWDVHSEILNLQSEIGFGFHVRYERQGSSVRILTAATRRGIDMPCMQAEPNGHEHRVTLLMEVNSEIATRPGQVCDFRTENSALTSKLAAPGR